MQVPAVSLGREALAVGDAECRRVATELQVDAGFGVFFLVSALGRLFAVARAEVSVEGDAAGEVQVDRRPLEEPSATGFAVQEVAQERPPRFVFGAERLRVVPQMDGFFLDDRDDLVELVEQLVVR